MIKKPGMELILKETDKTLLNKSSRSITPASMSVESDMAASIKFDNKMKISYVVTLFILNT